MKLTILKTGRYNGKDNKAVDCAEGATLETRDGYGKSLIESGLAVPFGTEVHSPESEAEAPAPEPETEEPKAESPESEAEAPAPEPDGYESEEASAADLPNLAALRGRKKTKKA